MDDWPYWVILLKYGSHDMRHTGFRRLTMVNGTTGFWGVTKCMVCGEIQAILPCIFDKSKFQNMLTDFCIDQNMKIAQILNTATKN